MPLESEQKLNINQPSAAIQKSSVRFGLSIAIVAICLVASGVAVYWIKTEPIEQSMINITAKKSTGSIEGWQTYRNEKYGFEMKYPQNWAVENGMNDAVWIVDKEQKNRVGKHPIIISITPERAESMESWFEERIAKPYRQIEMPADYEDIVINGIKGRELPIGISEGGCDRHLALFRDGLVFNIFRHGGTCGYNKNIINAVISSFKSISQ